ncbi:MAG TPA: ATP-binding protein, partial [Longimicrobiaceae bacterium]|nr:ATP-binding protein [Longimicrobiaceae bacterium]
HELGRKLLLVRYSELESQWAGATAKNVAAVFRAAAEQEAVLFFDEADAIASRRFASPDQGYQREANAVVNVLLRELEAFPGVVIFATNLAANFDPAFERRIRTHILFEMPGAAEREAIWHTQIHARRTPLAEDVDFHALAQRYEGSGGDIKNAVLKAAQIAIAEPGPDAQKRIHQRHFAAAMDDVASARRVMEQTLFGDPAGPLAALAGAAGGGGTEVAALEDGISELAGRLTAMEDDVAAMAPLTHLPDALRRMETTAEEGRRRMDGVLAELAAARTQASAELERAREEWGRRARATTLAAVAAVVLAVSALAAALLLR